MRHIKFDESTVMNEFIKIAQTNGMLKSAGIDAFINLNLALQGKNFDVKKLGSEWAQYCNQLAQNTKNAEDYLGQVKQMASQLQAKVGVGSDKLVSLSNKFVGANWPEAEKQQRAEKSASLIPQLYKKSNNSLEIGKMFLDLLSKELQSGLSGKPIYAPILSELNQVLISEGFHAMMTKAYTHNADAHFMAAVKNVMDKPEFMNLVENIGNKKTVQHNNQKQVSELFLNLLSEKLGPLYTPIITDLKAWSLDGLHKLIEKAYTYKNDPKFMTALKDVMQDDNFINALKNVSSTKTATDHSNMKKRIEKMLDAKNVPEEERVSRLKDVERLLKDLNEFESNPSPKFEVVDEDNKNKIFDTLKQQKEKKEPYMYCPWCEKGDMVNGLSTCPECETKMSKTAKYDVYDVSGETGEDLVESAHGNLKGTETELTVKPEDDGGLIETIVERQKKDIEVAQKKPTGVYAHLYNLSNNLKKAGLNKYALKVDALIPYEEIVKARLHVLATELEKNGYRKYATTLLDNLGIKTARLKAEVQSELNNLNLQLGNELVDTIKSYNDIPEEIKSAVADLNNVSFSEAYKTLQPLFTKNNLDAVLNNTINDMGISKDLVKMNELRKELAESQTSVSLTSPSDVKINRYNSKIKEFQVNYNGWIADVFGEHWPETFKHIREDGILGPETQRAADIVGGMSRNDIMKEYSILDKRLSEKLNTQNTYNTKINKV